MLITAFPAKVIPQSDDPYSPLFANFLEDESLANASVSFCVVDAQTRHQVFGHDVDRSLMPASNMKIITTVSAVEIIGPDHQFVTKLAVSGEVVEGVLKGNVYIIGGGDPTLGSPRFDRTDVIAIWAKKIHALGISRIQGQIIAVDSLFEDQAVSGSTAVGDVGNYYGAGAHAINWNDNQVDIYLSSENVDGGTTTVIRKEPDIVRLELFNYVKASNQNSDQAYIHGAPGTWERSMYGSIQKGKSEFMITGSIPDPAHQVAAELHFRLEAGDIQIAHMPIISSEKPGINLPSNAQILHEWKSPKLRDILIETNRRSVNTYADVLLKQIGLTYYGTGSYVSGVNAVKHFWSQRGVPTEGWYQEDGSGLSRANSISAQQLALVIAKLKPVHRAWFKSGLRQMAGDSEIVAKSGHIKRVRAYTGFMMVNGKEYAFSIMVNNFSCSAGEMRKKIEVLISSIKNARIH